MTTQIFNKTYDTNQLGYERCNRPDHIKELVEEYKSDPNCYPALWITDIEFGYLNEIEKAIFVYQSLK